MKTRYNDAALDAARAFAGGLPPTVEEPAAFDRKTFEKLLTAVCDTSFECGEWSPVTTADPYAARWEAASRAEGALRSYVQASAEAPRPLDNSLSISGVLGRLLASLHEASTQAECIVLERAISQIADVENTMKRLALPMT